MELGFQSDFKQQQKLTIDKLMFNQYSILLCLDWFYYLFTNTNAMLNKYSVTNGLGC